MIRVDAQTDQHLAGMRALAAREGHKLRSIRRPYCQARDMIIESMDVDRVSVRQICEVTGLDDSQVRGFLTAATLDGRVKRFEGTPIKFQMTAAHEERNDAD